MIDSDTRVRLFFEVGDGGISNFQNIPCCACPVRTMCHEGGEVNPIDCEYLNSWLGLDAGIL